MSTWTEEILAANDRFRRQIDIGRLPKRRPGARALVTCIDPRMNLAAIGIDSPLPDGTQTSRVFVVRTAGARIEERSLVIGMFLAGIRDITILTHTDCAVSTAHTNIGTIDHHMSDALGADALDGFRLRAGRSSDERRSWLRTFTDPAQAARDEVDRLLALDFAPPDLTVRGMVYDVATGVVDAVAGK